MTWFKIDDGFWSHPKMLDLSDSAVVLWVRSGAYSCQHLTDGFIPTKALRILGDPPAATELVAAGLWEETPGGYLFHDWAEYQETSQAVKARRESAKERQRRSRVAREAKKHPQPPHEAVPDVTRDSRRDFATPDPTRPISNTNNPPVGPPTSEAPTTRTKTSTRTAGTDRGHRLPDDWQPPDDVIARMRAQFPDIDLRAEHAKFVDYWHATPGARGRKADWNATWRNWIRRADEHRRQSRPPANGYGATGSRTGHKIQGYLNFAQEINARGNVTPFPTARPVQAPTKAIS